MGMMKMRTKLVVQALAIVGVAVSAFLTPLHQRAFLSHHTISSSVLSKISPQKQFDISVLKATKLYDGEDDEDEGDEEYADKAYKEYFRQRANLTPEDYERLAFQDYYGSAMEKGLMEDIMAEDGIETQSDLENTLEGGISRRALLAIPLVSVAAIGTTVIAQRWKLFRQYTSFSELDHPLDPRTVRRPFARAQLQKVISKAADTNYKGIPKVPVLSSTSGLQWLSGSAFDLSEELSQKGRVVVYHFWRRTDIDSTASLKKLEDLAKKFAGSLTVVSIHSPKFDDEKTDTSAISSALQAAGVGSDGTVNQYIVSDPDLKVWTNLGLDGHPAVVLGFSGQQQVPSIFASLGERAAFSSFVDDAVEEMDTYLKKNNLRQFTKSRDAMPLQGAVTGMGSLKTPMGIAIDGSKERVFISDTGNNRVIIADFSGKVLKIFGSKTGKPGLADGGFGDVQFNGPRGLAIDPIARLLWIADGGNNCLRRLSLQDYTNIVAVKPQYDESSDAIPGDIMEDFEQIFKSREESAQDSTLYGRSRTFRTPIGVAKLDSFIYVSAASSNQIWRIDDAGFRLSPVVGSGVKGSQDYKDPPLLADRKLDSLLADDVRFSQPAGLCGFAGRLFVSEADSSSIRRVNFKDNSVTTILGGDKLLKNNLALFGDRDGTGRGANFQHPTGLCAISSSKLLLCDSLNNKVKMLSVADGAGGANKSRTFVGSGKRGYKDGSGLVAEFNEPTAIAYDSTNEKAWVCDTMNNEIRIIDMITSEVSTFKLKGL